MFLPNSLIRPSQRDVCRSRGCGKPSHGKQYCPKHLSVSVRRQIPNELKARIRSDCCEAKCIAGAAHDNGEQYCTKCKEACCWKTV